MKNPFPTLENPLTYQPIFQTPQKNLIKVQSAFFKHASVSTNLFKYTKKPKKERRIPQKREAKK